MIDSTTELIEPEHILMDKMDELEQLTEKIHQLEEIKNALATKSKTNTLENRKLIINTIINISVFIISFRQANNLGNYRLLSRPYDQDQLLEEGITRSLIKIKKTLGKTIEEISHA